jgi:hypothetical protein
MAARRRTYWTYDRSCASASSPAGRPASPTAGRRSNNAVEEKMPRRGDVSPVTPSTTIGDLRHAVNGIGISGARPRAVAPFPAPHP